jgi:hypothetical protein
MKNEWLLIFSMIVLYGAVLAWYKLFGRAGMYCFTVFATIAANIEALLLIDAFGMEMTLGNILFATTFLVTDILSETEGKQAAQKAVWVGIATSVLFIVVSQSWLLYTVSENDIMYPSFLKVFSNTPRMMIASLVVYAIAQGFDVWMYHFWWRITARKCGDNHRFLWLRNNGSTLISQFLNSALFTAFAFWGIYDIKTLISIALSSYVIFIVTSLADTPVVYLARYIKEKDKNHKGFQNSAVKHG